MIFGLSENENWFLDLVKIENWFLNFVKIWKFDFLWKSIFGLRENQNRFLDFVKICKFDIYENLIWDNWFLLILDFIWKIILEIECMEILFENFDFGKFWFVEN